ncbi:TonB-dependent receptor [Sphingomonas carotinifaciens]|uniref:TonB-dependent receptor n=1 Tax=Sphingomonas carotinifaciens TaxID=1166323 RepID=UPI0039A24F2D
MKANGLTSTLARSVSLVAVATCLTLTTTAFAQTQTGAEATNAQPTTPPGTTADPAAAAGQLTTPQTAPASESAATDGTGDEIVVTGIRASLERSIAIKRNSTGIVDAISAEDIGKFPDTNLAESLQRITGVSINRTNGEGALVTVRGFGPSYNLVTLNGRQLATANVSVVGGDQNADTAQGSSRSFDFSNLASEGVRTLEVYKTGRAAIPTGGIGATINVVTRRPLDGKGGLTGSVGAKALYDTSTDGCLDCGSKVTPELSGVLNWADPTDRFGVSLFGSYQKRNFTSISATSNDWNIIPYSTFLSGGFVRSDGSTVITGAPTDPNQLVGVPNDSRYHYAEGSRERINGQAVLQFKPIETVTLTADALFAQNRQEEIRSDLSNWFSRPFDEVRFDGNPTVATATYLHETINGAKDEGFEAQNRAQKSRVQDYGLNMRWDIADNFSLNIDGHYSKASSNPNNPNGASSTLVGMGANVVTAHSVDYSGDIPKQDITLNGPLTVAQVGSQIGRTFASSQEQRVKEIRADFGWDLGGGSRVDFGGNFRNTVMDQTRVATQQTLGDWGITNPGDVERLAPGALQSFCLICKFRKFDPGNDPESQIAFRGNAAGIYSILSPYYAGLGAANAVGITTNEDNRVREKIWSAYAQVTWKGEIANAPATLVGGLRYEKTKSRSISLVAVPAGINWVSDNDFTVVISNQSSYLRDRGSYDNFLPSIDFQVELQQNLIGRVSYSKTIARPEYGNLFTSTSVNGPPRPIANGGIATASTGNAQLVPLESDNFDASIEWYYKHDSYVSLGLFDKRVRNFIGNGQFTSDLFGLRDPSSGAAGTRSGQARAALQALGADQSDVNLFALTALLDQTGSIAAATTQFQANYNTTTRSLNDDFVKQINSARDVIANGTDVLYQFQVTQPVNNRDAEIYGLEVAGQHFFGSTGFGVGAAYTLVRGDVGFNIGASPSEDQFALLGLSDTFNATLIYDKYGLSARVAYNWRDKFLSGINRQGSRNPEFTKPFGQLDVNISYDITPNFAVSFEGINLTEQKLRTYARDESQLWFGQELRRRFLLGGRFRF